MELELRVEKEKEGLLDKIAYLANKLPHPVTIFIIFTLFIAILSSVLSNLGTEVISENLKGENEIIRVKNLLSSDGIRWFLDNIIKNFVTFHPLGVVLVFSLFFNFLNEVGLFQAFLKNTMEKIPKKFLTYFVVFLGVNSSFAGDLGYILIIPIAGVLFKAVGRNPLAGILVGFSATSAGFAACLLSIDALLGGLSTAAIKIVDPNYLVNPLANSVFMFVYTFFITFVISILNDKYIEPKLEKYEIEDEKEDLEFNKSITIEEKKGLKWAAIGIMASIAIVLLFSIPESAPLRHPVTKKLIMGWSPLLASIVPISCFIFFVPGLFYGVASKKISNDKDLITMLFKSVDGFGAFLVLCFFASQFIGCFGYTEIGKIIAIRGGNFLATIGLKGIPLLILFIFFCSFVNLFIGSMSSKYALLAPIFLPILYKMGISPELAQLAYRIGDSSTNIISPLMSYFALMIIYCNKYNKKFGMGEIITYMIPYSIAILTTSIIFLVCWLMLNLPIGIGSVNFL
ncbi:MAG: AbgT family transporter [Cetobacterium sp.]|uniref:AbgT family transporter n=1 Tax=Cetobacterium sp. TaxID=2071632 RepID=UPI002FC92462